MFPFEFNIINFVAMILGRERFTPSNLKYDVKLYMESICEELWIYQTWNIIQGIILLHKKDY